jgi:transcriptional regulator with PAS, ATPase and Fis domain
VTSLYDEARRIAATDLPVLLGGETGAGKEVLASFIHQNSLRQHGPFVAVNCAAIASDLVESELLGVERGAATGVEERAGKLALAADGTLLLDEVGEMSASAQAVLLRVVDDGAVTRVGGTTPRVVSVRLICATNRPLAELAMGTFFRQDLFFRLNAWVAELPPLRHRHEDIQSLGESFLREANVRYGKRVAGFSACALDAMVAYPWPGNIRQLRHTVQRAVALAEPRATIEAEHLNLTHSDFGGHSGRPMRSLSEQLADREREILQDALRDVSWSMEAAALQLRVSVSTLYRRVRELGLSRRR